MRSGPTNQLYNIIKYLDRSEFDPYLVTLSPEPEDSRWVDYEALGVHLYSLGMSRLQGFLRTRKRIQSLLSEIKPDVIHTQGIRGDIMNVKLAKNIVSVCTARNYPYYDYPAKFGAIRGIAMAYRHIAALKKLKVVACSMAIQAQLRQHGINSFVIQNGIDILNYCLVDHNEKNNIRKKIGIEQDSFVFLVVGSLIPRKDVQTIINAFNNIKHEKKAQLIILGNGHQLKYLQGLVKNDLILFHGNVGNVVEYLQAADVFISSSLSEGLPNTVLEAMACGLPCLLSDIPPHKEITGETEWEFPCKDHMKLASLIGKIENADTSQIRNQNRQKIENNFNAQKMSQHYQNIYCDILR
jgi:glycosyltransferase involved in cell wall biosynthesis